MALNAHGDEYAPVTPYRPSVSSPAQLPAAGQLELELGGLASKSDEGRRASLPYTLKLALDSAWGLVLGGEGLVSAPTADGRQRGMGDTQLVLKRAYVLSDESALGWELGTKLPTARSVIGSGKADYSVNGIVSQDLGAVHMDANLNLTRLGAIEPGSGRTQMGVSAAFAMALDERWGISGEWSGNQRRGSERSAQLLLALSFSPSKLLTLDFGMSHGLTAATPSWSVFSGAVLPLARLW
ncbi:transporter [Pseudoduganella sp. FT93W]|uniref:Transporter n=1 Tax=Duganella fentianensis TaxID=2692177 RepID=A0A845I2E7_9BURK|nr:transporter [Duganella fentianensis]